MGTSKVTDYMIDYMEKKHISAERLAKELDISTEKLDKEYEEPLLADEFLALCVWLRIRPEEIMMALCEK